VGEDGATHQCIEDIAIMRALPGMRVVVPADDTEARAAVRCAYATPGPFYLRLARLATPVVFDPETYEFELGRGVVIREGTDVTVFACGLMVSEAIKAANKLAEEGISAEVINIHTIKPIDEELVIASARKTGRVVTVEEHTVIGGLGSAVCDVLSSACPVPVRKVGVQDSFGESGPAWDLLHRYGLDADGITHAVHEVCAL
jgi:transketolase